MIKVSLRSLLFGAAVTAGLMATAGAANAVEYNFGDLNVHLDTTITGGASVGTSPVDHQLLPTAEGGPVSVAVPDAQNACVYSGGACTLNSIQNNGTGPFPTNNLGGATTTHGVSIYNGPATVAGSINAGDSRLNFQQWDLYSGSVKMTNDLSASFQNYKFFARLSSYYDAVLNSDSSYRVRPLTDGKADAARDVKLLDFYGSADYNVGDLPLNVRAGKQVISWGESTFIQNGINVINPVDVAALRRPGAELKDFFIPVWAADASIGLPYNLSLEAFYQFKWDTFALDRGGTPFAGSDVAAIGSTPGGVSFLTGSYGGSANCSNPNSVNAIFNADYAAASTLYAQQRTCGNPLVIDYTAYNGMLGTLGGGNGTSTVATKLAYQDNGVVYRSKDNYARNSGQWGLAGRWYSEELNNTEFGIYFMNYHSRLPYVNEKVSKVTDATWGTAGTLGGLNNTPAFAGAMYQGCNLGSSGLIVNGASSAVFGTPIGLTPTAIAYLNQGGVGGSLGTSDPYNIYASAETIAQNFYSANVTGATPTGAAGQYAVTQAPTASIYRNGGQAGLTSGSLSAGTFTFSNNFSTLTGIGAGVAALNGVTVQRGSALEAMILNCALVANQVTNLAPINGGTNQMVASPGTQILSPSNIGLSYNLVYPEDIKMVGASFNTTIGTWGVQGEVSYRPSAPFQLDTDQMTIAALGNNCVLQSLFSPTVYAAAVGGLQTMQSGCGQTGTINGVVHSKMWTGQVGTTATYSNSNALVEMTGADLGIIVSEVGMVYVPDAVTSSKQGVLGTRWGNLCNGGTDLPLGGALSLAPATGCRPTPTSWGFVLLGQLQYNNAFGTAVTLTPTTAFTWDVKGRTPAPYGNYEEGRKSVSIGLNGSFQSAWKAGITYTNFFGTDKYQALSDRDNLAASISYAF